MNLGELGKGLEHLLGSQASDLEMGRPYMLHQSYCRLADDVELFWIVSAYKIEGVETTPYRSPV
jgi:hypothetical protein